MEPQNCRAAIEKVAFPPARFDLVVSSLVLHYVDDYAGLVSRLVVERVVEPVPGERWLRDHPPAGDERRRPMFLLVRARMST